MEKNYQIKRTKPNPKSNFLNPTHKKYHTNSNLSKIFYQNNLTNPYLLIQENNLKTNGAKSTEIDFDSNPTKPNPMKQFYRTNLPKQIHEIQSPQIYRPFSHLIVLKVQLILFVSKIRQAQPLFAHLGYFSFIVLDT